MSDVKRYSALKTSITLRQPYARLNQPASGVYSADPLSCSGCVSGCFRCRNEPASAGDDRVDVACWVNDQQLLLCSKSPREDEPNNPMLHGQPRNIAGSSLRTDYCNTPLYVSAALSTNHSEQVPELSSFVAFADALGLDLRQSDDQWNSALELYEKLIAAYPQPSADLSAPSHGEPVLVPRSIAQRMATDAAQYDHEHAIVNDNVQLWQQKNARLSLTVGDLRAVRALLSAPSAGSQKGEAVEVVAYIDDGGALYTSKLLEIMSVESDGCEPLMTVAQHQRILAAATHPAEQVADGVTVSRQRI